MGVSRSGRVQITPSEENSALSPAVSHLFRSVAASYGSEAVGILLTGMGMDGVDGLLMMKERGAVTIVQDKDSATAYGMPGEAFNRGAAQYVFTPMEIAGYLGHLQS
jgi:two-component system chemotaxis response regulator CheB